MGLNAQQITFEKNYGWLDDEGANCIQQTFDEGYIICGNGVVKTDELGNTEWTRPLFGGSYIIQTSDSNYVIVGEILFDVLLMKLNQQGDSLWARNLGGIRGYCIEETSDNGYILVGEEYNAISPTSKQDIHLLKTDENGDTLWTKLHGGGDRDYVSSVRETPDNGYVMTGYTYGYDARGWGIFLIKTDINGDTLWSKIYAGNNRMGTDVQVTNDNGFIIAGYIGQAIYLIKTDSSGNMEWTKTHQVGYYNTAYSVAQTSDGGYIVGGVNNYGATDNYNNYMFMMRTDGNGDTLWTRTFDGVQGYNNLGDRGYSVRQTTDGGFVLAGTRFMGTLTGYDMYVIKTDSLGNVLPVGDEDIVLSSEYALSIYPNPFSEKTTIRLLSNEREATNFEVLVFDITGRKVKTHKIEKGQKQLTVNAGDLGAGIFIVQLMGDNEVLATKKMIIVK